MLKKKKLVGIIEKMIKNCRPSFPYHNDISLVLFGSKMIDNMKIAENLADGISRTT
jgi:hypothetical protein